MPRVRSYIVWRLRVACGVLGLVGCAPSVTTIGTYPAAISELRRDVNASGAWLASMPGALGTDIQELSDGDLLLLGEAKSSFLQRLSPEGELRWTLPFLGCGFARLARGDDDVIYVAMRGLLAVGDAAVAVDRRARCKASPLRMPATILRVNSRGELAWRWDSSILTLETPTLLPVPGGLLVVTHGADVGDPTKAPSSTIVKLDAQSNVAWQQTQAGFISVAGLSPQGRILLGTAGGASGMPCSVRALDAKSGATQSELKIGLDVVGTHHSCLPRRLSVVATGGVMWTMGRTDTLSGVDPETGRQLWTRDISILEGGFSPARPVRVSDLSLFVHGTESQDWRRGFDATLFGVEPSSGRVQRLARLQESVPHYVAFGPHLAGASWGRRALLLTGSFHGSLSLRDLGVEGGSYSRTTCVDIDPGFHVGPYTLPPAKRVQNPWRAGVPQIACPPASFAQRTRTFPAALFVAKLQMDSL